MAGPQFAINDPEIEIIPSDIQLGFDPITGAPRTEPTGGFPAEHEKPKPKPVVAKKEPAPDTEVTSLRQRLAESDRERARIASEAETARTERAAEREARERAEATGLEDRTSVWRLHMDNLKKDEQLIEAGLQGATNAQAYARREMRAAEEAGDTDRKIAATEALTTATSQIEEYQRGLAATKAEIVKNKDPYERFEAAAAARKAEPKEPEKKAEPEKKVAAKAPTVDDFIAGAPNQLQDWLKQHRDFATPNSKQQKKLDVFAADWLIDHDGDRATLDTEEFRTAVDAKFFPKAEEAEVAEPETEEVETAPEPAKAAPRQGTHAAPVSRPASAQQTVSGKGGAIKLTQEQYAIAPELIAEFSDLDPDFQDKFKVWSPTAARYQYERNLKRAQKEKPHRLA